MIYWFTGQPGAGKTTLAKAIIALLPPEKIAIKGQIYYQDQPLLPYIEKKMQKFLKND